MTFAGPAPAFVERDPSAITSELVALYERLVGRPLQPAQVERLLIDVLAYRETLVRLALQEAAEQNLVAFARADALDRLGELVGATRLPPGAARTTLRFTLAAARPAAVLVPAGTVVVAGDAARFATDVALVIPAGALTGDVGATAAEPGPAANGYLPGAVSQLTTPVAWVASVANLFTTMGGTAAESDERFRERVRQAPTQYSVAGSAGAYRYHALSVSSEIADVAITSAATGVVRVCVLAAAGDPSPALLAAVQAALSADRVRPLSDTVVVVAPTPLPYAITATLRPLPGADPVAVRAAALAAAEAYAAGRRARLGLDVVPSQVIAALSVPGVYDVALAAPAAVVVGPEAYARCSGITLDVGAAAGE